MLTKNADFERVATGKIFPVKTRIFSVFLGSPRATSDYTETGVNSLRKNLPKTSKTPSPQDLIIVT